MPRYFFDINGRRDEVGVLLDTEEAAVEDAQKTVAWLAKHDRPSPEYGDEWTCIVRDANDNRVNCVTRLSTLERQKLG